jgi:hypothetical protein
VVEGSAITPVDPPDLSPEIRAALPTFFIIGAAKTGTTSLHTYLADHPEVTMSATKEPMCFEPPHWVARLEEYGALFGERPRAVRGEASTAYAAYPWVPEIPDRVKATVPDARIIYIVRDPVPRAIAHHAQNLWDRFPVRSWDELMEDLEDPMNMPVWCSRYATQLSRWIERFPPGRVLVLEQRSLLTDRRATLRRVFDFLGVDPEFSSPAWDEIHNTAGSHRRANRLARALGARGLAAAEAGRLPWLLTSAIPKPKLNARQRERLEGILRPEAEQLRDMTGLDLPHWTIWNG